MDVPANCPRFLCRLIHSGAADSIDVKYMLTAANSILYKSLIDGEQQLPKIKTKLNFGAVAIPVYYFSIQSVSYVL